MATPRKPKRPNASYLKKTPSEVHEGFAAYITETTGMEVDAGLVALVQRLYPVYLKSPAVVEARAAEKAAREAEAARKAAEKEARLKERLAKIEEQRQRVLAELGLDDVTEPPALSVVPDEEEPEVEVTESEDEVVVLSEESDEDEELWDDDEDESDEEDF